jgi:uncharacterized protein YecE (DUF72 family)
MGLSIGAAGWYYEDWKNVFYPPHIDKEEWLTYYAKFFDFTEINNTFYNLPTPAAVEKWTKAVPDTFRFAVKVWQKITHDTQNPDVESLMQQFFNTIGPLESKIAVYLLQFPPRFGLSAKHLKHLNTILHALPQYGRFVLELRDNSWFDPKILGSIVDGKRILLGTSYMDGIDPYYYSNQNLYYIRMIGNRNLTKFAQKQREQPVMMVHLQKMMEKLQHSPSITDIFVIFNNHFRGFSPLDINEFKKLLRVPYKDYRKQHSLTDFI